MTNQIKRNEYKFLDDILYPEDLRKLPENELETVCTEVRDYLIDTITKVGGHFGAGLGVIELTVALHYVYNTPVDKIIFDTGHQGYPHKILTGRKELLHTIRKKGGLSGFLKRTESEYDAFGAGHASTSISAALGMAVARDLQSKDYKVVSIIGDGAMTGGLAFEAMNNIGVQKKNITVILNDNNMSISPNVSAISNYFNELFASNAVQKIRGSIWDLSGRMDELGDRFRKIASRLEKGLKAVMTPGLLFEAFGFKYFGPINGHNVNKLVKMLQLTKDMEGPILLHVITRKGKGYIHAESDNRALHAIGKIDKVTGKSLVKKNPYELPKYQDVFADALSELMSNDTKIVGISAAMLDGTGLDKVQLEFPNRIIDVGIAEGHAVTFAAGLACEGIVPVCAIYSSFLQRAYDHLNHDVALQNLHVVFAMDRAGVVGSDGPTHHGVLDISCLRSMQNIVIMAPKDEQELRDMLYSAIYDYKKGPVAIRFPRGEGLGVELKSMTSIPLGKSEVLREGTDIALLPLGKVIPEALIAAELLQLKGINAHVVNPRFVKPLDYDMLDEIFSKFSKIITFEDGQVIGGFGSAVLEYMNEQGIEHVELYRHGINDGFVTHGTQEELYHELMLDSDGIVEIATQFINKPLDQKFSVQELYHEH